MALRRDEVEQCLHRAKKTAEKNRRLYGASFQQPLRVDAEYAAAYGLFMLGVRRNFTASTQAFLDAALAAPEEAAAAAAALPASHKDSRLSPPDDGEASGGGEASGVDGAGAEEGNGSAGSDGDKEKEKVKEFFQ